MRDNREPQHDRQDGLESSLSSEKVEPVLSRFAPAPLAIDRDRLMFLAGRADALAEVSSANPAPLPRSVWPWLTLLSTAAVLVMAVLLSQKPTERVIVVERPAMEKGPVHKEVVRSPQPQSPSHATNAQSETTEDTAASRGQENYVLWRERVLREGVDVLAQAQPTSSENIAPPATQRELLQEFYGPAATRRSDPSPRVEWWNQPWLNTGDRS